MRHRLSGLCQLAVLLLLPVGETISRCRAADPLVEFESAFEEGTVRGADGPHHLMVASRGHVVGAGWGRGAEDLVECPFDLPSDIGDALLTLRYSWKARENGKSLKASCTVDDGKARSLTLEPCRILEEFAIAQVRLGKLAAGRHSLALRLSRPEEVWLDAFSVSEAKKVPELLTRRLHFDNLEKGGHFRLVLSPHVSEDTHSRRDELLDRLEADYKSIRDYLGHEPAIDALTCCLSAKEDSAGGAAHARGSVFFFDEEGALDKSAGNRVHEMTHCFQDEFANNGWMPAWIREGEAFFLCCIQDTRAYGKTIEEATWPPFRGRSAEQVRRAGLDDQGINTIQYFRTEQHPREGRPYYLIWNWVFFELFKKNPEILRQYHDRLRAAIAGGTFPLEEADRRDAQLVSSVHIAYLLGDDREARDFLTEWGLITWPCENLVPARGPRVLHIDCGAKLEGRHVDRPWKRALDRVGKRRGFSYEVEGARCWRGEDETHWFYADRRHGMRPLRLRLVVPKGFVGTAVLWPDTADRVQEVRLENDERWTLSHERRIDLPVDAEMSRDGRVDIEVKNLRGINGALARVELFAEPKPGKTMLSVVCAERIEQPGRNLSWRAALDRVERERGFSYRVTDSQCWTDGRSPQWFHHDRRFGNEPLRFVVTVPKNFKGRLLLCGEPGGRVQRVSVEGRHSFTQRGDHELAIPIEASDTADGEVRVEIRRLVGNNCALRSLRIER